jgi:hypothetical protein
MPFHILKACGSIVTPSVLQAVFGTSLVSTPSSAFWSARKLLTASLSSIRFLWLRQSMMSGMDSHGPNVA